MEPYTAEGMARVEAQEAEVSNAPITDPDTTHVNSVATPAGLDGLTVSAVSSKQINYELVGVVVHSGQANAGHYYSFIKDRRSASLLSSFHSPCSIVSFSKIISSFPCREN